MQREPRRIQLRRTKGWRKPEGAVVVARPSRWGNPFRVVDLGTLFLALNGPEEGRWAVKRGDGIESLHATRANALTAAVGHYRSWATEGPDHWHRVLADVHDLAGRDLACWCPLDRPCHADVLLDLANGGPDAA